MSLDVVHKTKLARPIDKECKNLCKAINKFPGIRTVESCSGHGKSNYFIAFEADSLRDLPRLLFWFDACHCGFSGWKFFVHTDCIMSPVTFQIKCENIGRKVFQQAEEIARMLEHEVTHPYADKIWNSLTEEEHKLKNQRKRGKK